MRRIIQWGIELWLKSLRPMPAKLPPKPCMIIAWHEDVLAGSAAFAKQNNTILLSASDDGSTYLPILKKLGWKAIRGSSNRKSYSALKQIIQASKEDRMFVTVDGPKGPRRKVKQGAVVAAKLSDVPIYALRMIYPAWILHSTWDKMKIPKPWGRVQIFFSEALRFNPKNNLEQNVAEAENLIYKLGQQIKDRECP